VRPRRLGTGSAFTWRFKTKDYWQAVGAPQPITTVQELMALHEPWVTSSAQSVLAVIRNHGGQASLDEEGLIVVEVDEAMLAGLNAELAALGCTLSNELLHTV
jgi:hypothetical protein